MTDPARRQRAWRVLVGVLAIHVADEALTGFLDFYNPLVRRIRGVVAWFPMPTFTFDVWLIGLAGLVAALTVLTPVVRRGGVFAAFAPGHSAASCCSMASDISPGRSTFSDGCLAHRRRRC